MQVYLTWKRPSCVMLVMHAQSASYFPAADGLDVARIKGSRTTPVHAQAAYTVLRSACSHAALPCRKQKVLPGDLSEAQEFAQSKGQAQKQGRTGVRFADVAGCSSVLAELKDVVEVRPSAGLACAGLTTPKTRHRLGPCMLLTVW